MLAKMRSMLRHNIDRSNKSIFSHTGRKAAEAKEKQSKVQEADAEEDQSPRSVVDFEDNEHFDSEQNDFFGSEGGEGTKNAAQGGGDASDTDKLSEKSGKTRGIRETTRRLKQLNEREASGKKEESDDESIASDFCIDQDFDVFIGKKRKFSQSQLEK